MISTLPNMVQADEALRLLAQMYARWFIRVGLDESREEMYAHIRDILYNAVSQKDAHERLTQLAEGMNDTNASLWRVCIQAQDIVQQVIQAHGSVNALVAGQTDGFRHLCLTCSQNEQNFQRVHFFNGRDRRLLLMPEIGGTNRSVYSMCQICHQPINPNKLVIFSFAGTTKHTKQCLCRMCNRAGTAFLLSIYECEPQAQRVLLPYLQQVSAPSKQQCVERAVKLCWENGWYMFNRNTILS